jgi:two-component system C4-dicarboxylate transport response regulator DctD
VIIEALRRHDGNMTRTAEAIQLPKTTLFGKIRKYDIALNTKE